VRSDHATWAAGEPLSDLDDERSPRSVGLSTVVFVLGLHPRTHNPLTVLSTSFVGATAFVLGIDCFSRAGLKELYVWNLGFRSIFDVVLKPHDGHFRLGDVGIVEIALIGILWVLG
jgi:hypothetical protein